MTSMEVKGQRSNGANYVLWLPYLVKIQAENDDDLYGGQRSSEVKCGKLYDYHIWSKELVMQAKNDDDLHGGQRSSEVKYGNIYRRWAGKTSYKCAFGL